LQTEDNKIVATARILTILAALLAGLAVAAGAFASHALQGRLSDRALAIFETATRYQMYHALALLFVALLLARAKTAISWIVTAGGAFVAGIVLFSGSLYALSLTGQRLLGIITPIGGVAFLGGWICLAIAVSKMDNLLK
jgi:uncharacterized membrane protein YgdD (TMEM256/DUF423 family)